MNWEKCFEYCKELYPQLVLRAKNDISGLELQVGHQLILKEYTPSILLIFGGVSSKKECPDTYYASRLNKDQEKELKRNKEKILYVVSDIATQFNIEALPGGWIKLGGVFGEWLQSPQGFTFKPDYNEFIK